MFSVSEIKEEKSRKSKDVVGRHLKEILFLKEKEMKRGRIRRGNKWGELTEREHDSGKKVRKCTKSGWFRESSLEIEALINVRLVELTVVVSLFVTLSLPLSPHFHC